MIFTGFYENQVTNVLNSNLNMTYKKYFNEDTNKWVHKSILVADGKMVDTHGMVYIKKA